MSFLRSASPLTRMLRTRTPYAELAYSGRFTQAFLDHKARRGDPLGDRLVAQMAKDRLLRGAWRDLIDLVIAESRSRGGVYEEFIDRCFRVPSWADFDRMRPSQRMIFTRLPGNLMTGLVTFIGAAFVPSGLSAAAASQLVTQGTPRLMESGTFILKPGLGMKPGSVAHKELIRVRVLHAAVRHFMGKKRGQHAGDQLLGDDAYINQSQMAYFLTSFSFIHMRTAVRMGVRLSDRQIRSHHHRWQYMGYLMGVDDDLLTDSIEEEKQLAVSVLKREVDPELCDPFFLEMIEKMVANVMRGKSEKAKARRITEFRVMLLHAIGDDFIGGWAGSMDDSDSRRVLRQIKRRIAVTDLIQRQKLVEMLQYYVVKKQFIAGHKKLLLAVETTNDGTDTLGEIGHEPKRPSRGVERFRAIVDQLTPRPSAP